MESGNLCLQICIVASVRIGTAIALLSWVYVEERDQIHCSSKLYFTKCKELKGKSELCWPILFVLSVVDVYDTRANPAST